MNKLVSILFALLAFGNSYSQANMVTDLTWNIGSYSGASHSPTDPADLVQSGEMHFEVTLVDSTWGGGGVDAAIDFDMTASDYIEIEYKTNSSHLYFYLRETGDYTAPKAGYNMTNTATYIKDTLRISDFNNSGSVNWTDLATMIFEFNNKENATYTADIKSIKLLNDDTQPAVDKELGDQTGLAQNASFVFDLDTIFSVGSGTLQYSASSTNLTTSINSNLLTVENQTGVDGRFCVEATATETGSSKSISTSKCYVFGNFTTDGNPLYSNWVPYKWADGIQTPASGSVLNKDGVDDVLEYTLEYNKDTFIEAGIKLDTALSFENNGYIVVEHKTDDDLVFVQVTDGSNKLWGVQITGSSTYQVDTLELSDFSEVANGTIDWSDIVSVNVNLQGQNKNGNTVTLDIRQFEINVGSTKLDQTLSIDAIATQDLTTGTVTATYTQTGNSETVVLSSTTTSICTVSGDVITLVAEGECELSATKAGDATYNEVTATASFFIDDATVDPVDPALTLTSPGDIEIGESKTLSASSNNSDAITYSSTTTSICTVSGNQVTGVAAGSCILRAEQSANVLYTADTSEQTVTVIKATATITFTQPADLNVGAELTLSASSNNSESSIVFTSLTTSICTVSGSQLTGVAEGTCQIEASQVESASFEAASSVTKSLTVSLAAKQDANLVFTQPVDTEVGNVIIASATSDNSNTISFRSLTPSICTVTDDQVTTIKVGTCQIEASQLESASHKSSLSTQTFAVVMASSLYQVSLSEFTPGKVDVYSIQGQWIQSDNVQSPEQLQAVVENLSQGIYILKSSTQTYRVIR